jgi:hypothetical protein
MKPVTASATMHAERLKARDAKRAKADDAHTDTRQTYEIYAERAAAGARADEALRERAKLNELRARGMSVPGDEADVDEDDEEREEVEESADPTDNPERRAARAAWKSARVGGFLAF